MPAWRLDEAARVVLSHDVGGSDSEIPELLGHVLLCAPRGDTIVKIGASRVPAVHMGPPLQDSDHEIDVLGSAELSPGEGVQIKVFVDEAQSELASEKARLLLAGRDNESRLVGIHQYIIFPASREADANVSLRRFNCVGFVLDAYSDAGIELVAQPVPSVDLEDLKRIFPSVAAKLDRESFRKQMGIGEGSAWPVILAGHVANAFHRTAQEIRSTPFVPVAGDEFFPSRRQRGIEPHVAEVERREDPSKPKSEQGGNSQ